MSWLEKLLPPKIQPTDPEQRRAVPEGVWIKCPSCETVLYKTDLEKNLNVCPKCDHHHRIGARARLDAFLDPEGRWEIGQEVMPIDALKFKDSKKYPQRLKDALEATGETDALVVVGGAVMSIGIVLFTLFPAQLLGLFTEDPQVIAIGVPLMRLAAIFQFFDGIQVVSAGALRGAGDVRFPFVANVVSHWMVGLPTALLLGFHFGMQTHGFWIGLSVGLVSVALAMSARFYRLSGRVLKRV